LRTNVLTLHFIIYSGSVSGIANSHLNRDVLINFLNYKLILFLKRRQEKFKLLFYKNATCGGRGNAAPSTAVNPRIVGGKSV
jgi:hypothetical protein